jgi:hypothetical protein
LLLGLDLESKTDQAMVASAAREAEKKPVPRRWAFIANLFLNSSSSHLC